MNQEKLYELLGDIDPDMIAAANKPIPFYHKRSFRIALIAAVLACTVALTTVAGAFTLALGSGVLSPDPGKDDSPTDTNDAPSKQPGGLAGELFDMDWGALMDAFGSGGAVNWQDVLAALQGNSGNNHLLEGNVYKSAKQEDGTVKIVEIITSSGQTVIEIPETLAGGQVTTIGEGAFKGNSDITHVSIPDTVTTIENGAFCGCTNLTTVDLSENVQKIGEHAFSDCISLTEVDLPTTLQWLGEYAFANCDALTSLKMYEGIKEIPDYAFYGTAIKSVFIPPSVVRIGDYAFAQCHDLENVSFTDPSIISASSSIISMAIQPQLESIGASAFDATAISNLSIPSTVTDMYDVDFDECWNLQFVSFSGNAPTVQLVPTHDKSSPAYTVYYMFGAQGFSEGQWYGYTCQQFKISTDQSILRQFKKHLYSEITILRTEVLGQRNLSGVDSDVTVLDSYKEYQQFAHVLTSERYDPAYFREYAIVLIRVSHASSETVLGLSGLGAQLYTTGGKYYLGLYPVVQMNNLTGNHNGDLLYTYLIAEVQRSEIRTDDVIRVGDIYTYDITTNRGSLYHKGIFEEDGK